MQKEIIEKKFVNNFEGEVINYDESDILKNNEIIIYNFKTSEYSSYLKDSLVKNEVRTITEGRSQILLNSDLIIEESNYVRYLYFNEDGSLRWTYVNGADDGNVYSIGWSRILYTKEDIRNVHNLLRNKEACDE